MTLERAMVVALAIHLLFGGVVTWWPGLLLPAEAATPPESRPLEFRFVDTPDREPPPQPPDTETLSDRDRQVADMSERDDQPTPFSEGNTPETVMRLPQPASQPSPEQPASQPTPEAQPAERPAEEPAEEPAEQPEAAEETVSTTGDTPVPQREEPQPTAAETPATTPSAPQPNRNQLLRSITSLERYTAPQVTDNRAGGAPGPRSLAEFDTKGIDLGPYLREVLSRIEMNWHRSMPPLLQTGVGGSSFVALSIRRSRDGAGNEVATLVAERTWSSGQPAYDSAALFALELSNPLPPIPEFFPYDSIEGRLGFIYNLDPSQVRFPEDR